MPGGERIYQVNLEELIEDYVWMCYKKDLGFFRRIFRRRGHYIFDVRWGYLDFSHVTNPVEKIPKSSPSGQSSGVSGQVQGATSSIPTTGTGSGDTTEQSAVDAAFRGLKPQFDEAEKKDIELYFSEYENKTETEQSYKFTATRQTTTTTRVEMQENYTLGLTTNLEVNLAEIVKIGAEASASFSVTETKAEEFSKSLTWNIDTEIRVPRWNKAKATLYVYEMPSKSNFVVKTTVKLTSPLGLPVTIRQAKDGKEVHTEWITDLGVLFNKDYLNRSSVEVKPVKVIQDDGDEFMENHIVLTTRGVCRNVAFKNQHVKVECHEMEGAPPLP